jgi:hypothetical protein
LENIAFFFRVEEYGEQDIAKAGGKFDLILNPEGIDEIFLRNMCSFSADYTALYLRRWLLFMTTAARI